MKVIYSSKLENWIESNEDLINKIADANCTNGYDNDGSTGFDIFENGVDLGINMAQTQRNAYYGSKDYTTYFILAKTEEEAIQIAQKAHNHNP